MANKVSKLLQPQYLSEFQCIGTDCEDSCCIGWRVQVDKETYQSYRRCSDEELRKKMDESVTRVRSNAGDFNYAKIKNEKDGKCPFLDQESLCSIQRKLGEEYLSITCSTYPRTTNIVNGVVEKSLTMSCPEGARLALLNKDLMSFDETVEDSSIRNSKGRTIETDHYTSVYQPQKYFWELRIFIITLLQKRSYSLWQRLVILGLFCRNLDQLISEGQLKGIEPLVGRYMTYLDNGDFMAELTEIPNELTIQMKLVKEIADERIFVGVNSKRFMECFSEFLYGTQYTVGSSIEEIGERYSEANSLYYQPFIREHEYILENYLVNYVFKNLFPFSGEKQIFDNYVMLIVHYAMIKMLLIGMAGYHKENLTQDHFIKLIQSFSKTVEHNSAYLKKVIKLLRDHDLNTMPYMAILIKN